MGHQPEHNDPGPGDEVRIPAALVRSRTRGRAIPLLPRTLGVALVVGFLAFAAGVQFDAPRGTGPTVTEATPTPSESPVPTPAASPSVLVGRSRFANTFDPTALMQEAGLSTCSGSYSGGSGRGQAYVISVARCSVAPALQAALVLRLESVISAAIRRAGVSREGGVAGPDDPDGPTVTSWNYRSDGFDGSIYLVATHTGTDFQVSIVLSEQVPT